MILYGKIETTNLGSVTESRDNLLLQLNQTIEKFNKTLYHPQLIIKLIEFNRNTEKNSKKLFEEQFETSIDEGYLTNQLNLLETIKNLETQIKKLSEENIQFNKKKNELELCIADYSSHMSGKTEEINKLKRKLCEEKLLKEEIQGNLNLTKKQLKEIERNINKIEEENLSLKKSQKNSNEKLKEFELVKNKNSNLSNEIKYKESVINYLERILESNNISFSKSENVQCLQNNSGANLRKLSNQCDYTFKKKNKKLSITEVDSSDEENQKDLQMQMQIRMQKKMNHNSNHQIKNMDKFKNNPEANENKDRDDETKLKINLHPTERNESVHSQRYNSNSNLNSENENSIRNSLKEFEKEKVFSSAKNSNRYKNEYDNLDDEIKHLQSKLKTIIDVGKK